MFLHDKTDEPEFNELILKKIPMLARVPRIRAAMERYTSGYLTEERLDEAIRAGTPPRVELSKADRPHPNDPPSKVWENTTQGHYVPGTDIITINGAKFEGYKERHPTYLILAPVTVFHELAHWGYDKGQREGHSSDAFGRQHKNHGQDRSPLDDELEKGIVESAMPLLLLTGMLR